MVESTQKPKRKRRWLRISLRTFLILIVVFGSWLAWYVYRVERQKNTLKWVKENGGWAGYAHETDTEGIFVENSRPPSPEWVAKILGFDYYCQIVDVDFLSKEVDDWSQLSKLTGLKYLCLYGSNIKDLEPIARLTKLQILTIDKTQVAELTPLSNLKNLKVLSVSETNVADAAPLANLKNLVSLNICGTKIKTLTPLQNLRYLQEFFYTHSQFSEGEISRLHESLPNCRFYGEFESTPYDVHANRL